MLLRIEVFENFNVIPLVILCCIRFTTGSTDQTMETIFAFWPVRRMAFCSFLLANILIKIMGSIHALSAMEYHIKMEWPDWVVLFTWMWKVINHVNSASFVKILIGLNEQTWNIAFKIDWYRPNYLFHVIDTL